MTSRGMTSRSMTSQHDVITAHSASPARLVDAQQTGRRRPHAHCDGQPARLQQENDADQQQVQHPQLAGQDCSRRHRQVCVADRPASQTSASRRQTALRVVRPTFHDDVTGSDDVTRYMTSLAMTSSRLTRRSLSQPDQQQSSHGKRSLSASASLRRARITDSTSSISGASTISQYYPSAVAAAAAHRSLDYY